MERQQQRHTICLLGGTGFVGSHVVRRLAAEGHHIRIPTRHRERHRHLLVVPRVTLIETGISDPAALAAAVDGADVVINLVGILNERREGDFQRIHVELPRRVVEACRARGVRRLLHMSALGADAAYGASEYQRSKGEGENVAHSAGGMKVTIFRPSVIFGPGDSFFNRFAALLKATPWLFPLACPNTRFAPVYVGDVADAFTRAIDKSACVGRRYDLCGPREYTLKELVEFTARTLGLRRRVMGLNDTLSRLQARLLEFVPGKPFSRDNYLTMQHDNVCDGPFPEVFGIMPSSVEGIVPYYLGRRGGRAELERIRSQQNR